MADILDDALFSILQETKTLTRFLDVIFGFLSRRTDFYHVSNDPNLGVGFPEGVAESVVLNAYRKYAQRDSLCPISAYEETVIAEELPALDAKCAVEDKKSEEVSISKKLDCYNGAQYDGYSWSQSITDIDIQVKVPDKVKSKQLNVNVSACKVYISSKVDGSVYLDGELCRKCKPQETLWSLNGDILQVHLEKASECWWEQLIDSEPKLDLSMMDCSRPFHELPEEAQAKIEELQWNQERKRLGLPTSDQLDLQKTLKQAWNVDGSPFTGEYDPSKVLLN